MTVPVPRPSSSHRPSTIQPSAIQPSAIHRPSTAHLPPTPSTVARRHEVLCAIPHTALYRPTYCRPHCHPPHHHLRPLRPLPTSSTDTYLTTPTTLTTPATLTTPTISPRLPSFHLPTLPYHPPLPSSRQVPPSQAATRCSVPSCYPSRSPPILPSHASPSPQRSCHAMSCHPTTYTRRVTSPEDHIS